MQNIITKSLLTSEVEIVTGKIEKLKKMIQENPSDPELILMLKDIKEECDCGIPKRVLAAKCGLYTELVKFVSSHESLDVSLKLAIFDTLTALMTGTFHSFQKKIVFLISYLAFMFLQVILISWILTVSRLLRIR